MGALKRVLVALDFSDCAWEVCERALALAEPSGAEVVLAHVTELPEGVSRRARVRNDDGENEAGRILRDGALARLGGYDALFRDRGLSVRHHIAEGPVAEALLAAIRETEADHVVMGTHGRKGVARAILGSVAERVVRASAAPVTTVRTTYQPSCAAANCAWCTTHVQTEQQQISDEAMG